MTTVLPSLNPQAEASISRERHSTSISTPGQAFASEHSVCTATEGRGGRAWGVRDKRGAWGRLSNNERHCTGDRDMSLSRDIRAFADQAE